MKDDGKRQRTGNLQCERSGVWTMRVSCSGKSYSRTTGTTDYEKAKVDLAKFVTDMECEHMQAVAPGALLSEWPRYECSAESARLSPGLRMNRYRIWRCFSAWMASVYPEVASADAVTRQMVEEYLDLFGENHAAMSFNLCISHLRRIFATLLGRDAGRSNPLNFVAPRTPDSHTRRDLSVDELRRLFLSAESEGDEWARLVAIAVYTGLRLGDCCRLRWESVDIAQGIIQLVPHKTRRHGGGRIVTIPVHEQLMKSLAATSVACRSGYIMPGMAENYEVARWRVTAGINRIFKKAGIERNAMQEGRHRRTPVATFHSIRHTFVSLAANAGVPLVVVQAIIGHTSTAMTRHYYHANEAALRKAVDAIPSFGRNGNVSRKGLTCPEIAFGYDGCACGKRMRPVSRRLAQAAKLLEAGYIDEYEYSVLRERILQQV